MKFRLLLFLIVAIPGGAADAEGPQVRPALPAYSLRYDPVRDAFQDGRDAVRLAKATGRHVLIEVGGDWCTWCHALDRFLDSNPDIKARLHETFVLLKVNVSDANDNADFLKAFPRVLGYPHMYVADTDGGILLSKDTADFLTDGRYSRQRFAEFLEQWKPTRAKK